MSTNEAFALNSRFILEPYASERVLKAKETSGFAMVAQKTNVVGLKILMETTLTNNKIIPTGYKAYIKEEYLYNQPWAKAVYDSAGLSCKFIIVDPQYVEFVGP